MNMKKLICMLLVCVLPLCAAADTGSWGQINQELTVEEDWQRIVTDSPFALGEAKPYAENSQLLIQSYGAYPSIDGSTVCVPMAMELARQHLSLSESDLTGFVTFSTTPYAYERLIGGKPNPTVTVLSRMTTLDPEHPVDLILVTEPSADEVEMAQEAGVALCYVPFCYDAFVFLVNDENPVKNLSVDQIRDIYIGNYIDWGDVGGTRGSTIRAYQRPHNSGSQTAMENMVMQGVRLVAAEENYISDGMSDLVEQIGEYPNAIDSLGYSFLYYITALYTNEHVKVLSIDGIAPTPENLRSGAYPYTVCYYAVYREGDENTEAFVNWLVSTEGQRCVAQAGYVTLED